MSAAPLLLVALVLLTTKKKPKPKPLPKPVLVPKPKPPAKVVKLIPGTPPKGGVVPGSAPKGAVNPSPVLDITQPKIVNKTTAELQAMAKRNADRIDAEKKRAAAAAKAIKHGVPPLPKAKPAGPSVKASPELEPRSHGSLPPGYAPGTARARARALASHLAKKGPAGYSRPELKTWQQQAALKPDGLYGGSTRGALIFYGVKDPPRPFAAPVATLPYVPPENRK